MFVVTKLNELFTRLPDVIGNLLLDLKPPAWVDFDPLQVADHNVDDQISR